MRYFIYCRKSSESEDRQVLSIESQLNELRRSFGNDSGIEIVEIYEEAFSAKAPGRKIFDQMLRRIERGEAQGIIAWHPDRLARNSVDGGKLIWFLDRGLIKDLKFATYTFENNPQGKFMLSIFLGQSKYYVDALSENVKRGNRTKVEKGWRPNKAPIGYLNCRETHTIIPDPERFSHVQRLFELMTTGAYSVAQLCDIARDEWGLRTKPGKRRGGMALPVSAVYRVLTNPFYAGVLVWKGQSYPGKHEPLITLDDFEIVQRLLGRPHTPRQRKNDFVYRGLIRCGGCGLTITGEHKVNKYGSHYTYYHCTRRNGTKERCRQPSIQAKQLDAHVCAFLGSLSIPPEHHDKALDWSRAQDKRTAGHTEAQRLALEQAYQKAAKTLDTLTHLRIKELLDDEEYGKRRAEAQREQLRLRSRLERLREEEEWFELVTEFVSFSIRAVDWFKAGAINIKRRILVFVGSNFILKDKILSITAKKPFIPFGNHGLNLLLRTVSNDIRTLRQSGELDSRVREMHAITKEMLSCNAESPLTKKNDEERKLAA